VYSIWNSYVMGVYDQTEKRFHGKIGQVVMKKDISFELTPKKHKLWAYGDSFAAQPAPWLDMVTKGLGDKNPLGVEYLHVNHAWPGSSLDYTSVQINKTMGLWEKQDVVVVCLTEVLRIWERWEHKDHGTKHFRGRHIPESAILDMKDSKGSKGLEDMPLQPTIQINTALRNHLIRVLSYADVRAVVVLDGFKNKANSSITIPSNLIYSEKGYLMEVSIKEPEGQFRFSTGGPDWRKSHLSDVNHPILAEKVITGIKEKAPIDLTFGFERDIFRVGEEK